jgi:hypothetical protein
MRRKLRSSKNFEREGILAETRKSAPQYQDKRIFQANHDNLFGQEVKQIHVAGNAT